MDFTNVTENINDLVDVIKIFFIIVCTYYTNLKIANKDYKSNWYMNIAIFVSIVVLSLICKLVKQELGFFYTIIFNVLSIGIIFSMITKSSLIYSILITIISLSVNYILLSIGIIIDFIINMIINIKNDYINLIIIISIYILIMKYFFMMKKLKKGIIFLHEKLKDEYFNILVFNISTIILFIIVILSNYNQLISKVLGTSLIIFSIIMFITIQKSLQLYYKQKLLVQELNETKKELDKKKQEIEQLERENLNFSKTSHSIAHRQKALEYKLNQLILKTEIASEIDIKDKINEIAKELQTPTEVELSKTNIPEIDNMLKYMQSECVKNKIDFQLQLSGNIHHMINKYVSKENLEILVADHIKNSIIAINHSNNINKSILIRLGIIDGIYSLYIYDSGVEFEIDTLLKLGKIPSTTHSDDGGTGMGFMNTFDTLKKYKASIVIKEYGKPCKDNYTKLIIIKFDDKNEYKICSYRQKEIKNKDNNNNLIVEELSL